MSLTGTAATIIIALLVLAVVLWAIRSVVRSRRTGGCDACGDSTSCPSCSTSSDFAPLEDHPHSRDRSGVANH
jgi:hypothetical protein